MAPKCEIRDRQPQSALAIRTRSAVEGLPAVMGEAFGAIAQYLGQIGEAPAGPPFARYHNMDMADLDIEIGFPTSRALPESDRIQTVLIPGGPAGEYLHIGPYGEIGPAYDALSKFVAEQGRTPGGAPFEFYLNDPEATPPEQLQILIVFPLAASG